MTALFSPRRLIVSVFIAGMCRVDAADIPLTNGANRFTSLELCEPFAPGAGTPKLTTPQWIGEPGVEAVVILGLDDMRDVARYALFLRPILAKLREVEGRAPMSIFCNEFDAAHPQLAEWLREGLSLEVHTLTHPCPILAKDDLGAATHEVTGSIDLLRRVNGNRPVAFRTPCCDSINSASPRLYSEILCQPQADGLFLTCDSSVMHVFTAADPTLPRELVNDVDGGPRFSKYLPAETFAGTIENHPYPYIIGRAVWEFPGMVPSDWEAQHLHDPFNPKTLADWNAALDLTVIKQGVFAMIFHPHGWINPEQVAEFIGHVATTHGKKVRFLSFRDADERLTRYLFAGQPLRTDTGGDNGVRLLDLNGDGFQDVVIGNEAIRLTRVWDAVAKSWRDSDFPLVLARHGRETGARFGVVDGVAVVIQRDEKGGGAWAFVDGTWKEHPDLLAGLEIDGAPVLTTQNERDRGVRFRDVDGDGTCELIVSNADHSAIFRRTGSGWTRAQFVWPPGVRIVDPGGRDDGLRFIDANGDGYDDLIHSNAEHSSLHLYVPKEFLRWQIGWSRPTLEGRRNEGGALPVISRGGPHPDNGAWFARGQLWVANEDTATKPGLVERRTFAEMLAGWDEGALPPAEALAHFDVRPGFKVELAAAEPLVKDPVAFDWTADGRLWVVEMADYPEGMDGHGKPGGRVRILEDTDSDGVYDKSSLFLDGLNFPNGITPWKNGVIISAPPEIIYAEDTDGDGKADVRRTIAAGFVESNQQHRANGFEFGLDGWLYCANGDGGKILMNNGKTVDLPARDFRLQPDAGLLEATEGRTQYGRRRDDWGQWFGNANYAWLWHYPLPERYLARNPYLVPQNMQHDTPDQPDAGRVFRAGRAQPRFNDVGMADHVTAACSPSPYRDDLFGAESSTSVFISDPAHNIVHREVLEPTGATFRSHRAAGEEAREFLASSDAWFRPTTNKTGPDGALYIADMYRRVIEHPEWIPADVKKSLDLRAGSDQGRIWRVVPVGVARRKIPRLDRLDTAGLVAALDSPNGWQRDTAQRLILERKDKAVVPMLKKLATSTARPITAVQAWWTLDDLGALGRDDVLTALHHADPRVRRHGAMFAERRLDDGTILDAVCALADDPDPAVQHQVAFTLGEAKTGIARDKAGWMLYALAVRRWDDSDFRQAVLSSALPHLGTLLRDSMGVPEDTGLTEALIDLARRSGSKQALAAALAASLPPGDAPPTAAQMRRLAAAIDAAGDATSLEKLKPVFGHAERLARDNAAAVPTRVAAVRILAASPNAADTLVELLAPAQPGEVRQAALDALRRSSAAEIAVRVLGGWDAFSPGLRDDLGPLLMSRETWRTALLDAILAGRLAPSALSLSLRHELVAAAPATKKDAAAKMLAPPTGIRADVLQRYVGVDPRRGNAAAGHVQFQLLCAVCHRLGEEGKKVGADLATVGRWPARQLIANILDPNLSVDGRYLAYAAATKDGRQFQGIVTAESTNSVTLTLAGGTEVPLLRSEISDLRSTGRSLMPEGFEAALDPAAMADLLAYLAGGAVPKKFPGNVPATITPAPDGTLHLTAASAEIYGDTLVFESQYKNLGYWSSDTNQAAWTVDVPKAKNFKVLVDYALAPEKSTNTLHLTGDTADLAWPVKPTASWDDYREEKIGAISVPAGRSTILIRAGTPLRGILLDLRSLTLLPE